MPAYVYVLRESTGPVRYVGKSVQPEERLRQHQRAALRGSDDALHRWLRKHDDVEVVVLGAWATDEEAFKAERRIIATLRFFGFPLLNTVEGGHGMTSADALRVYAGRDPVALREARIRGGRTSGRMTTKRQTEARRRNIEKARQVARQRPITEKQREARRANILKACAARAH